MSELCSDFFMALTTFFATPFFRDSIEDARFAACVKAVCITLKSQGYEKTISPQGKLNGVFESPFDFFDQDNEIIRRLRNAVYSRLISVVAASNDSSPELISRLQFDSHSWFHITREGGYFRPHTHPMASWSAVYCADRGSSDLNSGYGGDVVFYDPRANASMFLDQSNRHMRRELSFSSFKIEMRTGDLMIFPSYLTHFVEPYIGTSERVTVAANFWVQESSDGK